MGCYLSNHTHGLLPRIQRLVKPKPSNVRMGTDPFETSDIPTPTFGAATCIEIFLKCYKISYKVAFAGTFRRCFGLRFLLFSIVCCRSMKEDKFTDSSIEIRMTTKQLEKIYKFSRQGCYSRATQNLKTLRNASTSSPIMA